jgi:hypothetical protein
MKSTGYSSKGCSPLLFSDLASEIAPMIAPMFWFARGLGFVWPWSPTLGETLVFPMGNLWVFPISH